MSDYRKMISLIEKAKTAISDINDLLDIEARETVLEEIATYVAKLQKDLTAKRLERGGPNDR